jgi:hypothetical protein
MIHREKDFKVQVVATIISFVGTAISGIVWGATHPSPTFPSAAGISTIAPGALTVAH